MTEVGVGVEQVPAIAGSYSGYATTQLTGSISSHFLGSDDSHLDCGPVHKTALLDCECGCPGCWTLMARVVTTPETVTWTEFEQVHRDWDYGGLVLTFDRRQYERALAAIAALQSFGQLGPERGRGCRQ